LSNLLRGQTDAACIVHGFDHIVGKLRQVGVESGHFLAFHAQDGIIVMNNLQQHGSIT
jgi:hypothetical protein